MNKSTRDEQRPPEGGKILELAAGVPSPGEVVAEPLRNGAQALLLQALEAEIAAHVISHEALEDCGYPVHGLVCPVRSAQPRHPQCGSCRANAAWSES